MITRIGAPQARQQTLGSGLIGFCGVWPDANQYTQPTENQTTIRNSSNFVLELLANTRRKRDKARFRRDLRSEVSLAFV